MVALLAGRASFSAVLVVAEADLESPLCSLPGRSIRSGRGAGRGRGGRASSPDAAPEAAASGGDAHTRGTDVLHDRDDRSRVGVQEPAIVDAAGSISLERPDGPRRLVDLGTGKESVDHHSGLSTEKMPGWASRVHPTIRRARIRQRPTFGTLDARRRALDSAGAPRSGRVSLDGLLVSDACFVRVEPRRPPRPSLAKQVPALVQRDLEPSEALTVGVGHLPVRFTLEQLVLLACKLIDPAEDLVIVHNASLLRLPGIIVPRQTAPLVVFFHSF